MKVLLGREFLELFRTRRVLFLPILFALFGIAGPAFIRFLPQILQGSAGDLQISVPEVGPQDGLLQFMSLARQFGLFAVVLIFMGAISGERRAGTLTFLFVKPVSRFGFLGARWLVNGGYVLISFLVGAGLALLYTSLLLGRPEVGSFLAATGFYLCYTLLVFSWTVFFSSLFRSSGAAGGASFAVLLLVPLLGVIWRPLGKWGPYGAVDAGTAAVGGFGVTPQPIGIPALVSGFEDLALSLILLVGAYLVIRKTEL